jgi:hypothetical protein
LRLGPLREGRREKGEGKRSLCVRNGEKQRIGFEQRAALSFGSDNIPLLASWLMMPSGVNGSATTSYKVVNFILIGIFLIKIKYFNFKVF